MRQYSILLPSSDGADLFSYMGHVFHQHSNCPAGPPWSGLSYTRQYRERKMFVSSNLYPFMLPICFTHTRLIYQMLFSVTVRHSSHLFILDHGAESRNDHDHAVENFREDFE